MTDSTKSVMIVGARGFIGSHVVDACPNTLNEFWPTHEEVDNDALFPCDYVIHAAGYAAPAIFTKDPIGTIAVNTTVLTRLAKWIKPGGTLIYCSSSEIYRGLTHEAKEDEIGNITPDHPRACYIEGKRAGEVIVHALRQQGFRAIAIRIGLTYGIHSRKHDARVINQFIEQALTTGKIVMRDSGAVEIDYCWAPDFAKMFWNVAVNGTQPVYNIGGVQRMTIRNLAYRIAAEIGTDVIHGEGTGLPLSKMDMTRYFKEFGYPEFKPFDEGLRETINYQRKLYGC